MPCVQVPLLITIQWMGQAVEKKASQEGGVIQ